MTRFHHKNECGLVLSWTSLILRFQLLHFVGFEVIFCSDSEFVSWRSMKMNSETSCAIYPLYPKELTMQKRTYLTSGLSLFLWILMGLTNLEIVKILPLFLCMIFDFSWSSVRIAVLLQRNSQNWTLIRCHSDLSSVKYLYPASSIQNPWPPHTGEGHLTHNSCCLVKYLAFLPITCESPDFTS